MLNFVLFINFITLFGSAFAFIPLSIYISQSLPIGISFAAMLIAKLAPGLFLGVPYAHFSNRFGRQKLIILSQLLAVVTSFLTIFSVQQNGSVYLTLFFYILTNCAAAPLKIFFPALLNERTEGKESTRVSLSLWAMIFYLSHILATSAGGYLQESLSLVLFIAIDALSFSIAFGGWFYLFSSKVFKDKPKEVIDAKASFEWSYFIDSINLINLLRNVTYGLLNPFFPALFKDIFHLGSKTIGVFYFVTGLSAAIGSKFSHLLKISYPVLILAILAEASLLFFAINSLNIYIFFMLLFTSTVIMAQLEVTIQTIFLDKEKTKSNTLSAVLHTTENGGMLIGFAIFILFIKDASSSLFQPLVFGLFAFVTFGLIRVWRAST